MEINITVNKGAYKPIRSNPTDAGADLKSPCSFIIPPKSQKFVSFGICLEIPEGYAGFIYARSGLGSKHGITPRNCVGVIDSKYRGEVGVMLRNDSNSMYEVNAGDRIAQLVISPIELPTFNVVDELDMEGDRKGGFGSSGK